MRVKRQHNEAERKAQTIRNTQAACPCASKRLLASSGLCALAEDPVMLCCVDGGA
jgi:hypothetical protein